MEMFSLKGKAVLVTGASSGIGRHVALAMAEAGANLVLWARRPTDLAETAEMSKARGAPQVIAMPTDVTDAASVARATADAVKAFGRIDAAVINAGQQNVKPFLEMSEEEWRTVLETNLAGSLHTIREVGRGMVAQGSGSIIAMGSIYGFVGAAGNSIYALTKGGLMQFVKSLAIEWARANVRLNSICPGWIETDLTRPYMGDDRVIRSALRNIPLHRFGQPQDIGPAAVYLASDASSFVTGQSIVIDGGQIAR